MIFHGHSIKMICLSSMLGLLLIFFQESTSIGENLKSKIVFSTQHELNIISSEDGKHWENPIKLSLPNKSDIVHHPSWMPNGDDIILEYRPWTENIYDIKRYLAVFNMQTKKLTPFQRNLFQKEGNLIFPKWSPNGKLLAILFHEKTDVIKDNAGKIIRTTPINRLIIYDKNRMTQKVFDQVCAGWAHLSWSQDSKKIAYRTCDDKIAVFNIDRCNTVILNQGRNPIFHPLTSHIFYVALDKHLYRINTEGEDLLKIDNRDWSWFTLIDFSKDGSKIFFIGGGSSAIVEYSTIDIFSLDSHKTERLSEKYGIIHGASLYED
jgi:Tol biopolymer transport system component